MPSKGEERDEVFIAKTNGSSCRKSRPKHLIQPQSSTRATPCAMPCGRLPQKRKSRAAIIYNAHGTKFARRAAMSSNQSLILVAETPAPFANLEKSKPWVSNHERFVGILLAATTVAVIILVLVLRSLASAVSGDSLHYDSSIHSRDTLNDGSDSAEQESVEAARSDRHLLDVDVRAAQVAGT